MIISRFCPQKINSTHKKWKHFAFSYDRNNTPSCRNNIRILLEKNCNPQPASNLIVKEGGDIKKKNPWILHVEEFTKENNIGYLKALSNPECKATHKKQSVDRSL